MKSQLSLVKSHEIPLKSTLTSPFVPAKTPFVAGLPGEPSLQRDGHAERRDAGGLRDQRASAEPVLPLGERNGWGDVGVSQTPENDGDMIQYMI